MDNWKTDTQKDRYIEDKQIDDRIWISRYIDRQTDRQVDGHGEAVVMKLESGFPEAAFQIPSLHARSAEESR